MEQGLGVQGLKKLDVDLVLYLSTIWVGRGDWWGEEDGELVSPQK